MEFEKPEDLFKKAPNLSKFSLLIIPAGIAVIMLFTSFYMVGPDEVGVVRRFGRYVRSAESGLHLKLPLGIEKANKVRVKYIFKEEFGFRSKTPGIVTQYSAKAPASPCPQWTSRVSFCVKTSFAVSPVSWFEQKTRSGVESRKSPSFPSTRKRSLLLSYLMWLIMEIPSGL